MKKTHWELITGIYKNGYKVKFGDCVGGTYYYLSEGFIHKENEQVELQVLSDDVSRYDDYHVIGKDELNGLDIISVEKITPTFEVGDHVDYKTINKKATILDFIGNLVEIELECGQKFRVSESMIQHDHDLYLQKEKQVSDKIEKLEKLEFPEGVFNQDALFRDIVDKLNQIAERLNNQ